MKFVIAQPCRCNEHATDSGFMYLANKDGAIRFDSQGEAQRLIDAFAEDTGLCAEHKQRMAVIPEAEMGDDSDYITVRDTDVGC